MLLVNARLPFITEDAMVNSFPPIKMLYCYLGIADRPRLTNVGRDRK